MKRTQNVTDSLIVSLASVLMVLLAGCRASSAPGESAGFFGSHSDAPQWKVFGISLATTPEEAKQLILKQWPGAVISNQPADLRVSEDVKIPDAPRLVARPLPGVTGAREELVIQFDFHNHIVFISHGKSFVFQNAPMADEFRHAFSNQYAPGIDNGYGNLTYYSVPDGKIHQAYPGVGGVASMSYAGSLRLVTFPNSSTGEIDLEPRMVAIDPADKRSDNQVITMESYSFLGPRPERLYGYDVELESKPVWSGWVAEQQARRKAATSHLGDSLKGTKF